MWISVHDTITDNPKIRRMARRLGISRAECIGYLTSLWVNVMRHAPDGCLADWDEFDIAEFCLLDVRGQSTDSPRTVLKLSTECPERDWVQILIENGFLDNRDGILYVHDWEDHTEFLKVAHKKAKDRERKRLERRAENNVRGQSTDSPRNVHGQSTENPSRQDKTRQDMTGQDQNPMSIPKIEIDSADDEKPKNGKWADQIRQVFEHWKSKGHKSAKLSDKRKAMIRKALKEGYTAEDLKKAIDGIHVTPHNIGKNDKGEKYLTLEICLRNAGQIDRFMANAQASPVNQPTLTKTTRHNLAVLEDLYGT